MKLPLLRIFPGNRIGIGFHYRTILRHLLPKLIVIKVPAILLAAGVIHVLFFDQNGNNSIDSYLVILDSRLNAALILHRYLKSIHI